MLYGLLRDHDLTRILQHKAIVSLSMGGDNEDGGGGDDQPSTSKNRKKLKKDFFNQRQSKTSLKVDPNSPQITRIPIPELREHERMDLINTFQGNLSILHLSIKMIYLLCRRLFSNVKNYSRKSSILLLLYSPKWLFRNQLSR